MEYVSLKTLDAARRASSIGRSLFRDTIVRDSNVKRRLEIAARYNSNSLLITNIQHSVYRYLQGRKVTQNDLRKQHEPPKSA